MNNQQKPNTFFWIIAVVALIWNLMGGYQYALSSFLKDQLYAMTTPEQRALYEGLPSWYNIVFAIGVLTGILGSVMLLLRKKLAVLLFTISVIAVTIQMAYWVLATDVVEVEGMAAAISMPIIVVLFGVFLVWYSRNATAKGWLS